MTMRSKYRVTTIKAGAFPLTVTRKRLDAFVFQCKLAVYNAAEAQGMRDTRAAWWDIVNIAARYGA